MVALNNCHKEHKQLHLSKTLPNTFSSAYKYGKSKFIITGFDLYG